MTAVGVRRSHLSKIALVALCTPAMALAQFHGRTPLTSSVPMKCDARISTRMTVIFMGPSSLVSFMYEGKWLDFSLLRASDAPEWIFQDKAGELRWTMRGREGVLERGATELARCTTYLPVEVIMQPIKGSQ